MTRPDMPRWAVFGLGLLLGVTAANHGDGWGSLAYLAGVLLYGGWMLDRAIDRYYRMRGEM